MESIFKKYSPRFDGANYDIQKEKMKTHLLFMGLGYWILKNSKKTIVEDEKLQNCSEVERDLFIFNMRAREALLSTLPKNEYNQVKSPVTSYEFWKALESNFEGDDHVKIMRLKSWICAYQDAKMMEDESVRSYIGRISNMFASLMVEPKIMMKSYGRY